MKKNKNVIYSGGVFVKKSSSFFSVTVLFFVSVFFVILLMFPDAAAESAKKGVFICLETLIPTLFPFFVLSSLSVSLGASEWIGKIFSRFMRPLFCCSGKTAAAFVLGLLSGFPVGASTAVSLYKNGEITRGDCARCLSFSNNPSVGFVVLVVGSGIFSDTTMGWILYISLTMSSLIAAMISCRLFPDDNHMITDLKISSSSESSVLHKFLFSVRSGGLSVLNVSAFVIFFSVLCGLVSEVFSLSYPYSSLLYGFFEIASGVSSVNLSAFPLIYNMLIAATVLAWSGLSVHFQVLFAISDSDVSCRIYIFSKLLTVILNVFLVYILMIF